MSDINSFDTLTFEGVHHQVRREQAGFRKMLKIYTIAKTKRKNAKTVEVGSSRPKTVNKVA